MSAPLRIDITGLVLAGGQGRRLGGQDKGWVSFRGRPLVEQVIERVRPQVIGMAISANRSLPRYAALDTAVVVDDPQRPGFEGPLAGILAGFRVLPTRLMLVVPCDAPALPLDLALRLGRGLTPGVKAAVARTPERIEPLFCLLERSLGPSLQAALSGGVRSAAGWLRAEGAVEVPFDDVDAFENLNTPDALR